MGSRTNKPKREGELDQYFTDDAVARACVAVLSLGGKVLEPHAGGGAFTRAIKAVQPGLLYANDLDHTHAEEWGVQPQRRSQIDFATMQPLTPGRYRYNWIIGNPPYNEAEAHVRKALQLSPNVAFLLRVGFLGTAKRKAFHLAHPVSKVYLLGERPSFTGGGTDGSEYALCVWDAFHDPSKPATFDTIWWK